MTGRRSFITNLLEQAGELGLKEKMDKAGHVRIATTLGYVYERQQIKKSKGSLLEPETHSVPNEIGRFLCKGRALTKALLSLGMGVSLSNQNCM